MTGLAPFCHNADISLFPGPSSYHAYLRPSACHNDDLVYVTTQPSNHVTRDVMFSAHVQVYSAGHVQIRLQRFL